MNTFFEIFFSVCGIYGVYMLFCAAASIWGEKNLRKYNCTVEDDFTVINTGAESLEFCIRAALAEANLRKKEIIIILRRDDADYREASYIAAAFSRRHGNIQVNIT